MNTTKFYKALVYKKYLQHKNNVIKCFNYTNYIKKTKVIF